MARAHLHRKYKFSASHRLHCEELSLEENRAIYGKCANPHGHGHNYVAEVTVAGEPDATTGMVMNIVDLDAAVNRQVVSRFDLANLNCDPEFMHTVPTTENLSRVIYKLLSGALPERLLEEIRIEETGNNTFVYGRQ